MDLDESVEPLDVYNLPATLIFRLTGSLADCVAYGKSLVHEFLCFEGAKIMLI